MKKVLLIVLSIILLTGCNKKEAEKQTVTEKPHVQWKKISSREKFLDLMQSKGYDNQNEVYTRTDCGNYPGYCLYFKYDMNKNNLEFEYIKADKSAGYTVVHEFGSNTYEIKKLITYDIKKDKYSCTKSTKECEELEKLIRNTKRIFDRAIKATLIENESELKTK